MLSTPNRPRRRPGSSRDGGVAGPRLLLLALTMVLMLLLLFVRGAGPLPDLVVEVGISPAPATPDEPVTFTATVRNRGRAEARGCELTLTLDGEPSPRRFSVPPLDPDGSVRLARTEAFQEPGEHRIRAEVDVGNTVEESDEDNNTKTRRFRIRPRLVLGARAP